jgi:hypothetical protein
VTAFSIAASLRVYCRLANTGGDIGATFDNVRLENNGTGLDAVANGAIVLRNSILSAGTGDGIHLSGANGLPLIVELDRLLVSNNGGNGIASGGTLPVYVTLRQSTVADNAAYGVYAAGGAQPSVTQIDRNTIVRNGTGVGAGAGGAVYSRGNNTIQGNTVNGAVTGTYAGK